MTAARPDTWMPLYVGDYLRDTGRLTTEGHGAYLLLIMDYWTTGKPLPDDDRLLATVARCGLSRWKQLRPVLSGFFEVRDGFWFHGRIAKELERAADLSEKKRKAGSAAANARWQNDSRRITDAQQAQWQTDTPSQPPSPSQKEPSTQPTVIDAAGGLAALKDRIAQIINSPSITMFNRVDAWVSQGADPERDILPAIHAGLTKLGGPPRTLKYFDGFVADAIAARTAPLPKGAAGSAPAKPPLTEAEKRMNRLETLVWAVKLRKINIANTYSPADIQAAVAMGKVTADQIISIGLGNCLEKETAA